MLHCGSPKAFFFCTKNQNNNVFLIFIKERLIVKVFKKKLLIYSAILAVFKHEQNQILALLKIVFSLLLLSNAWKPLVKNCIIHKQTLYVYFPPLSPEFFEFQNSMLILYVTKRHISLTLNNKKFVPAAVIIQKKIKNSNSNISNRVKNQRNKSICYAKWWRQ